MSVLSVAFDRNTKFFLDKLFLKPFNVELEDGDKVWRISLNTKTCEVVFAITGPGKFGDITKKILGKDAATKVLEIERLLTFYDVMAEALKFEAIETVETILVMLLDGIVTGTYTTVPEINLDVISLMDIDDVITVYNPIKISQYVTDGIQCRRGYLTTQVLELGTPLGLQIPYSYLVMVVGTKVAFNQTLTYDHNILTKDDDNKPFQPIATGETDFVSNGFTKIESRNSNHCTVEAETGKVKYDLIGIMPTQNS